MLKPYLLIGRNEDARVGIVEGHRKLSQHFVPNQPAGRIGCAATTHNRGVDRLTPHAEGGRLRRCALRGRAQPYAACSRGPRLKIHNYGMVHRIA